MPENRLRVYDVHAVIDGLADTDSVLELRREFGVGMVTAFIRVDAVNSIAGSRAPDRMSAICCRMYVAGRPATVAFSERPWPSGR